MTPHRTSLRKSFPFVICITLAAGCSNPNGDEVRRLRAEVESAKAETGRVKADVELVRAELNKLRVAVLKPTGIGEDRGKSAFAGRFEASSALIDINKRQAAMAKLAVDAAEEGDSEVAKKCVDSLIDITKKQEVAYKSSLRLAKAGKGAEATLMAQSLIDINQKQKALAKIAMGDYQD